jgi:hypothetical protein
MLNSHCTIYDSNKPLTRTLPNDIMQLLKKLEIFEHLLYKYANVIQQMDNSMCGIFTISYATYITFGIDPEKSRFISITNAITFMKQHKQ